MAKPRQLHGPGNKGPRGPRPKLENPGAIIRRLMSLFLKKYIVWFVIVLFCILGTSFVSVRGTLFIQSLIDDYIMPLTQMDVPDYMPLKNALLKMACIYVRSQKVCRPARIPVRSRCSPQPRQSTAEPRSRCRAGYSYGYGPRRYIGPRHAAAAWRTDRNSKSAD